VKRSIAIRILPWTTLALLTVALAYAGRSATGQEEAVSPDKATSQAQTEAEPAKKFRGRLPNYYRHVVDRKQREAIYKIQEEFASKIAALKAQLEALTKQRDEKVDAVLTPEQHKKVAELAAAAKAERDSKKNTKEKPATQPPAAAD